MLLDRLGERVLQWRCPLAQVLRATLYPDTCQVLTQFCAVMGPSGYVPFLLSRAVVGIGEVRPPRARKLVMPIGTERAHD